MEGSSLLPADQPANLTLLVQNLTKDDVFHSLEVERDVTVEDLKCLLEIESQIPVSEQALFFKNKELKVDSKKLVECGVGNHDMIMLTKTASVIQSPSRVGGNADDQAMLNDFFGSVKQQVENSPQMSFGQMFNSLY